MAELCLVPEKIDAFKKALKDKDINMGELINMSTEARIKLLEAYAGTNAVTVNSLFEQKLVLKNKALGLKNWASKVGEIGRYSPAKKAELAKAAEEFKALQQERIFNPKEEESFYNSLADKQIGTHISREEAKNIFDFTKKAEESFVEYNPETMEWSSKEARAKYGADKVMLENYLDNLKDENLTIKQLLERRGIEFKAEMEDGTAAAIGGLLKDTVTTISDNSIALVASVDNSFIGRQGMNTLRTHPTVWYKGAVNSFSTIYQSIKSKDGAQAAKDAVMASVYSSPHYINGNYDTAKLIPKTEEQYPANLPERIPGIGRVFSASESAFTNSAIIMRTKTFDLVYDIAEKNGVVMDKAQIQDIGRLVNSATARGDLGKSGDGIVRLVLWAPKMLKASWDVLTAHTGGAGLKTPFARKEARKNAAKIYASLIATGVIVDLLIKANSDDPSDGVEPNPISSDFMRGKVGDTRIDLTNGMGSLITFIARGITGKTKSTNSGIISDLNSGDYGSKTYFDVAIDFLANKTTPLVKAGIDIARGRDFAGKKPTLGSATLKLTTPISVQNFIENYQNEENLFSIFGSVLDIVGINANTYSPRLDWSEKETKEMKQLQEQFNEKEIEEMNKDYNKRLKAKIAELLLTTEFKDAESDEQKLMITRVGTAVKKEIFKEKGFKYKALPKNK